MGCRRGRAGQHTVEFTILIGVATMAVVTMQFLARRGVQTGLQMVSDAVLDKPPAPKPPDPNAPPPSTVQVQGCDNGPTLSATGNDLVLVDACSKVQEQGDANFQRTTKTNERVTGASVNETTRLQVFKE